MPTVPKATSTVQPFSALNGNQRHQLDNSKNACTVSNAAIGISIKRQGFLLGDVLHIAYLSGKSLMELLERQSASGAVVAPVDAECLRLPNKCEPLILRACRPPPGRSPSYLGSSCRCTAANPYP